LSNNNSNNNSYSNTNYEIPLKLTENLEKEDIVQKFVIDIKNNCVKLELNHKYNDQISINVPIGIIRSKKDGWILFTSKFRKDMKDFGVDPKHKLQIYSVLNDNSDLINHSDNSSISEEGEGEQQETTIEIPYSEWSIKLVEKYINLQKETLDLIPELWEPTEFTLSVRTILRIKNITLPFVGIILGPSGALKTAAVELYRNTKDTCYRDSFSAKSFVSHNSAIPKEKLVEIDLLPAIKNKLFLTPELSPTFSKKEDELNEILGIITRVLDGHGYESQSGAQGYRGYKDKHMFVWIGAAVDVPRKVHRLLGTLGPKLYFFRMKKVKKDENDYLKQAQEEKTKGDYTQKIEKIKSKMNDYSQWFDSKPFDYDTTLNDNKNEIDEKVLRLIIRLAILLKHLRGNVPVYETQESQGSNYGYTSASLEDPNRAITQLKNLARGHALSQGRTNVTMQDIPLLIKVVLSTASKERVILFDHLLENDGTLDTIDIKDHLLISKKTALKTMLELVILEIVNKLDMDSSNNNVFQIQLKEEFKWFLSDEFKQLRGNFGKEYHDEYIASKQEKEQKPSEEEEGEDI